MSDLSPPMREVARWPGFRFLLVDPGHVISMKSRLVHDLGITGDDFDEFVPVLEAAYGTRLSSFPEGVIPGEPSFDAFRLERARGWIARSSPRWRAWCVSRIRSQPFTLEELEALIEGQRAGAS